MELVLKKLENFGNAFLEVITRKNRTSASKPKKIAGKEEGILYDLLLEATKQTYSWRKRFR